MYKNIIEISNFSDEAKDEIAFYIKNDTLEFVNARARKIIVKNTFYTRYIKRWIDFIIALIALIVTIPINLFLAIITFFDVGTPILFKQYRIGKDGKLFTIYKFRNMTNTTDSNGKLLPPQQRVTKWGKFVRKTSLDELLNFVSILKGDMSIIGPRPLLSSYENRFSNEHKYRFAVRPGLDCPQLKKMDHAPTWKERFDNDIWYVENCTFFLDIKLSIRVIEMMFNKKSTMIRSAAKNGCFLGYDFEGNVISSYTLPDKYYYMYIKNHNSIMERI